jgi:hypothetical protein
VHVADVDDEGFAGELRAAHPPRRGSSLGARLRATVAIGFRAGLLPSAIVLAVYWFAHRDAPLPWVRIGSLLAVYGPGVGILLATSVELLVAVADRVDRSGRERLGVPLVAIANPVTAGGVAGMVAGIAPGAIGVVVFGSYHGPFVGTALIAFGLIAGAMLVAVPLAIRARRARGARDDMRVIAAATGIATLILCAVAAVIAPVIVGGAFELARGAMEDATGLVGAVAGALGGGVVGVFIGIVIALGRSLRRA